MEAMTTAEVARALGISEKTARKWADAGRLPVQRTQTGLRIFSRHAIEAERQRRLAKQARRSVREPE